MNFRDELASLFPRDLLAGAAGRAFVLNQGRDRRALDRGLVESKVETAMWRGAFALTSRSDELPFTPFATATELDRAPLANAA